MVPPRRVERGTRERVATVDVGTRDKFMNNNVTLAQLYTAYAEVLKRIREEEPTKPSTRLSTLKCPRPRPGDLDE